MPKNTRYTCVDPQVGRLLADELSGALAVPGREADHQLFGEHYKKCRKCREAMLDHANETVTIPLLKRLAKERGVSFDEMLDAFAREVRATKKSSDKPSE